MKLTVVGCSGSFPGPTSAASCYLLSAPYQGKTWNVLLDMGSGALGSLQQHLALEDIDAVCLSHLHPDHYMDLCGFHIAIRWRPGGWPTSRVPVYGPTGTAQRLISAHGIDADPGMSTEYEFTTWSSRQPVRIGPFTITPFLVRHPIDEPYAFRVECDNDDGSTTTLAYSGDTDACQGLLEAAQDVDLFLVEAAYQDGRDDHLEGIHLNGTRAGNAAREARVRRTLLTHIPPWTDPTVVVEAARAQYDADIAVAVSGVSYQLP